MSVALVPVTVLAATTAPAAAAAPLGAVSIAARGMATPESLTAGPDGNVWFASPANNAIGRATPSGDISLFVDPAFSSPWDVTAGPDGNVWFTAGFPAILPTFAGGIGRITPTGAITVFDLNGITPVGITSGPDGNLWFTTLGNAIGRVTPAGTVTTFTDPTIQSPASIAAGADGNLWFTNPDAGSLGKITPSGVVSSFPAPGVSQPSDIAAGPDGSLWFTGEGGSTVGRMTTGGVLTTFDHPGMRAHSITNGPDGNLWITNRYIDGPVVRLTPAGVFTTIPEGLFSTAEGITAGPDGNLWVGLDDGGGALGRLTTAGTLTVFPGDPVQVPHDITAGPDGNLWFTNVLSSTIARMTPAGAITTFGGGPFPHDITAGPDGNLWFTIEGDSSIGRMTTAGVFTRFTDPGIAKPEGIVVGFDGNLWFTSSANGAIGRITPAGVVTMFSDPGLQKPWKITAGPYGALWFTDTASGAVGRITTAGAVTLFPGVAPAGSHPVDITAGPDGNLWFTNSTAGGGSIGRITPAGVAQTFTAPGVKEPDGIAANPIGQVWFTDAGSHSLGRVSMDGSITTVGSPSLQGPNAIAAGPDGDMWFTDQTGSAVGSVGTTPIPPGAPTAVTAVAGQGDATVSWSPADDGGGTITGYEVTATPGGSTCGTTGALTCTVGGLSPGTPVTFTVRAMNTAGPSASSDPSAPVVPTASSTFHPLAPARILDSRTPLGGWNGPLGPLPWVRTLQVTGLGGASNVPAGAAAVVANVTVTGGTAPSFLSVWPVGTNQPATSNLNFAPGETIANLVTVKLGTGGQLWISNYDGAVDVIVDVLGYYDDGSGAGDRFDATVPTRVLDSRTATGGWGTPLAAGTARDLVLRQPNAAAVPSTATAVVLNVTATGGSAGSFLTAWPAGGDQPATSNLNFGAGQTIPNLVIVPIGAAGAVSFANAVGQVDVVADLVGYFDPTAGTRFHAITPTRILDDRVGTGLTGPWGAGETRALPVAGAGSTRVPAGATGLVANVTATAATEPSFVTVFPHGAARTTSNLNFAAGQTIPNLVTVGIPASGSIDLYNQLGSVDLVADAMGYYAET